MTFNAVLSGIVLRYQPTKQLTSPWGIALRQERCTISSSAAKNHFRHSLHHHGALAFLLAGMKEPWLSSPHRSKAKNQALQTTSTGQQPQCGGSDIRRELSSAGQSQSKFRSRRPHPFPTTPGVFTKQSAPSMGANHPRIRRNTRYGAQGMRHHRQDDPAVVTRPSTSRSLPL